MGRNCLQCRKHSGSAEGSVSLQCPDKKLKKIFKKHLTKTGTYTIIKLSKERGNKMREELLIRMIRLYGFEHKAVIQFAELMEKNFDTKILETIVKAHEDFSIQEF